MNGRKIYQINKIESKIWNLENPQSCEIRSIGNEVEIKILDLNNSELKKFEKKYPISFLKTSFEKESLIFSILDEIKIFLDSITQ
jgi:hypothetical protein